MRIKIQSVHIEEINSHGEETYPEECCGILIGKYEDNIPKVLEIRKMKNVNSESKKTKYSIDTLEILSLEKELEDKELEMIGIYHSHPDHPSRPSETDLQYAWPNLSYIILSVDNGKANTLTSWRLDIKTEEFVEETIETEIV